MDGWVESRLLKSMSNRAGPENVPAFHVRWLGSVR